jgi:hypothetical protein
MVAFKATGMSFIYYKYRNDPKTYPSDTPENFLGRNLISVRKGTSLLISNKAITEYIYDSYNKMLRTARIVFF